MKSTKVLNLKHLRIEKRYAQCLCDIVLISDCVWNSCEKQIYQSITTLNRYNITRYFGLLLIKQPYALFPSMGSWGTTIKVCCWKLAYTLDGKTDALRFDEEAITWNCTWRENNINGQMLHHKDPTKAHAVPLCGNTITRRYVELRRNFLTSSNSCKCFRD